MVEVTRLGAAQRVFQTFDAAQSAPARPGKVPATTLGLGETFGPQPHAQLDPVAGPYDLQVLDVSGTPDDAFGQAEIRALNPRDRPASPASPPGSLDYSERDRGFFRDGARTVANSAVAPRDKLDFLRGFPLPTLVRFAAQTRKRREERRNSPGGGRGEGSPQLVSFCRDRFDPAAPFRHLTIALCHSVGPFAGATCTAVTLYSGQFVAQSAKSVVTTLACVIG